MNKSWIESMAVIVLYLSTSCVIVSSSAFNWEDGEYGGQVKWSFNCDFYDQDVDNNEIDVNDAAKDLIRVIGEHKSNRQDCGWLCWADVQCHYYSHSQDSCRIMSLKKPTARQRSANNLIHHVTMPYLADSETICGYIPSRLIAFNISVL
jgi:hypothetical protein